MYVKVRVHAASKKEEIRETDDNHFEISVREEAVQNMANRRAVELVAAYLHVNARQIRIISGHHSPSKIFVVDDAALR